MLGSAATKARHAPRGIRALATLALIAGSAGAGDAPTLDPGLVAEVVATFDGRVYPLAAERFGAAEDVDGDGRFTILVSSWLTRLAGGRYSVDGFVRGADFDRSVDPPFGNHGDM